MIKILHRCPIVGVLILSFLMLCSCRHHYSIDESERAWPDSFLYYKKMTFKQVKEKIKFADSAIRKDSNNGPAYYYKGVLELNLQNYLQADSCFKKTYDLNFNRKGSKGMLDFIHLIEHEPKLPPIKGDSLLF